MWGRSRGRRTHRPIRLFGRGLVLPVRHGCTLRIELGAKFANAVLQFRVCDFVAVLRGEASNGFLVFLASADAQRLPFLRGELQSRIDALLVTPIANVELFSWRSTGEPP